METTGARDSGVFGYAKVRYEVENGISPLLTLPLLEAASLETEKSLFASSDPRIQYVIVRLMSGAHVMEYVGSSQFIPMYIASYHPLDINRFDWEWYGVLDEYGGTLAPKRALLNFVEWAVEQARDGSNIAFLIAPTNPLVTAHRGVGDPAAIELFFSHVSIDASVQSTAASLEEFALSHTRSVSDVFPNVSLIDRSALRAILEEQAFGISGLADPETGARYGEMTGASHILPIEGRFIVNHFYFEDTLELKSEYEIRLIDVNSSEMITRDVFATIVRIPIDGQASVKYELNGRPVVRRNGIWFYEYSTEPYDEVLDWYDRTISRLRAEAKKGE